MSKSHGVVVCEVSCAGCAADELMSALEYRAFVIREYNGTAIYEYDAPPIPQQMRRMTDDGIPLRLRGWFPGGTGHTCEGHCPICQTAMEVTDSQGHDMECPSCGYLWRLFRDDSHYVSTLNKVISKSQARRLVTQMEPSSDPYVKRVRAGIKAKFDI